MSNEWYSNRECDDEIICPYCGKKYEPTYIGNAIKNGVVLPEKHGRLIDAEEQEPCEDAISRTWLKKAFHNYFQGLVHVVTEEDVQAYIDVAPSVTPKAEPCEDAISRQATLEPYKVLNDTDTLCVALIRANIMQQPSVNPQEPSNISNDGTLTVNVEDGRKISRVLVCGANHWGGLYYPDEQEPKTGQYEKHIDHTDCIWYGNDSGCPVTCSQYRDGWNDAMDYIFKNGKGYQPYRHDD